jgi:hypothetical protein
MTRLTTPGRPAGRLSPRSRLLELVGVCATQELDAAAAVTPDELAVVVREKHPKLVDEFSRAQAGKLLRSMARGCLKQRSDQPLQQALDLGIPDAWTLRVRFSDGRVHYVLADDASEDELLGAEREREHVLKRAEARAANSTDSGRRALERAKGDLERVRELLHRLHQGNAA